MEKWMSIWNGMVKGTRKGLDEGCGDGKGSPLSPGAARPVPPAAVAFHAAHLPGVGRRDGIQPLRRQGLGWHPPPPTPGPEPPTRTGGALRALPCPARHPWPYPAPLGCAAPLDFRETLPPLSQRDGGQEEVGTPRWERGVAQPPPPCPLARSRQRVGVPPDFLFLSVFRDFTEKELLLIIIINNISVRNQCVRPVAVPRWGHNLSCVSLSVPPCVGNPAQAVPGTCVMSGTALSSSVPTCQEFVRSLQLCTHTCHECGVVSAPVHTCDKFGGSQ